MIQSWKITKQWSVDLTLITDGNLIPFVCIHRHSYNSTGETAFEQDEYEEAIDRLEQLQVILRVV